MCRALPFRLNRSGFMLAIVSAAFAGQAFAVAGRVEFTIGGVTVARNGAERPLTRGTELDNGDTVRTNDGRTQIRFTDGAYVSLQPNTEYSIRDYRYDGAGGAEESGFFSLLKGAMRTVTGAIGRINRNAYRIATPTATVGIRGTGGVIQVQDDGSTLVIGTSGIWSLTNPAGSVDVPAGNSAVAPSDPKQPPQETTQQPTSGPAPVVEEEPIFVAGEERDEQGLPVIPEPPFTPLQTGPGYDATAFFTSGSSPQFDGPEGNAGFTGTFDSIGQLTKLEDRFGTVHAALESGGSHADFGTDGILAWGRWVGTATIFGSPENFAANQGWHYVIGMPTAVMPTSGTATYSLAGATGPTNGIDSTPGTFSGSLSVNFGDTRGGPRVDGSFNVAMPSGRGYAWSIGTNIGSGYSFSLSGLPVTGSGGACGSGCSARTHGFFSGASAERVGLGYHISDTFIDVIGAAAFKKN